MGVVMKEPSDKLSYFTYKLAGWGLIIVFYVAVAVVVCGAFVFAFKFLKWLMTN